jgi:hypothetical protein
MDEDKDIIELMNERIKKYWDEKSKYLSPEDIERYNKKMGSIENLVAKDLLADGEELSNTDSSYMGVANSTDDIKRIREKKKY